MLRAGVAFLAELLGSWGVYTVLTGALVTVASRLVDLQGAGPPCLLINFDPFQGFPHAMRGLSELVEVLHEIDASRSDGKLCGRLVALECLVELDELGIDASLVAELRKEGVILAATLGQKHPLSGRNILPCLILFYLHLGVMRISLLVADARPRLIHPKRVRSSSCS